MKALKRLLKGRAARPGAQPVEVSEARGVRTLHLGGDAIQSAIRLSRPGDLELAYTRAMMAFLLFLDAPREILMIGLGGGSIARFVHERMPEARMTVVELHPKVVAASRTFFGLPEDDERLAVVVADGADYLAGRAAVCDVLLLDAFDDGRSVPALATERFYRDCHAALRPNGVLVVNFIADEPRLGTYLERIEAAFDGRVLCMPAEDRVNIMAIALKRRVSRVAVEPLRRAARELKRRYQLPFERFVRDIAEHNPGTTAYVRVDRSADRR